MDGMGMVIWFKPARPSSVAFNPRVPQLKSRAKESTTHLHKHLAGWVIDPWKPIVCWAGWRCATNSDKINSELQAIGNPSVHPDLSEHFRLQVSPCTAVLRLLDALQVANRDLFFSRFSRQKRPWWFFGEHFVKAVSTVFIYGPNKNSPKLLYKSKTVEEPTHPSTLPVPHQGVQDDIWTSTHLIFCKNMDKDATQHQGTSKEWFSS